MSGRERETIFPIGTEAVAAATRSKILASAFAGSLLLFGFLAPAQQGGTSIEGIRITSSSGALRMHDILADEGRMAADGRSVSMTSVTAQLTSEPKGGEPPTQATLRAPQATVWVRNGRDAVTTTTATMEHPEVMALRAGNDATALKGDFRLDRGRSSLKHPVLLTMETQGAIEADSLVWSELRQRLVAPASFEQRGRMSDGTNIRVTGSGFAVDRDFREWTYYVLDNQPLNIEFSGGSPAAKESGKK